VRLDPPVPDSIRVGEIGGAGRVEGGAQRFRTAQRVFEWYLGPGSLLVSIGVGRPPLPSFSNYYWYYVCLELGEHHRLLGTHELSASPAQTLRIFHRRICLASKHVRSWAAGAAIQGLDEFEKQLREAIRCAFEARSVAYSEEVRRLLQVGLQAHACVLHACEGLGVLVGLLW
jgi:hypothetical protein